MLGKPIQSSNIHNNYLNDIQESQGSL